MKETRRTEQGRNKAARTISNAEEQHWEGPRQELWIAPASFTTRSRLALDEGWRRGSELVSAESCLAHM